MSKLADTLERLGGKHPEPWYIAREPDDHPDGTTHFTHVAYTARLVTGESVAVTVAGHVTPDLAELICTLHNNLATIIEALRKTEHT
jgi:hypothetical protein